MTASTAGEPRTSETASARARQRTAKISVAAAIFLVAIKLATGLATGSLAFLAEAVHSGTDLVAALLTLFAVRVAVRPPDREHHYGHAKLSARAPSSCSCRCSSRSSRRGAWSTGAATTST
jgi:divalent metal cation (Fe/Co/Zn/Cd) transporter